MRVAATITAVIALVAQGCESTKSGPLDFLDRDRPDTTDTGDTGDDTADTPDDAPGDADPDAPPAGLAISGVVQAVTPDPADLTRCLVPPVPTGPVPAPSEPGAFDWQVLRYGARAAGGTRTPGTGYRLLVVAEASGAAVRVTGAEISATPALGSALVIPTRLVPLDVSLGAGARTIIELEVFDPAQTAAVDAAVRAGGIVRGAQEVIRVDVTLTAEGGGRTLRSAPFSRALRMGYDAFFSPQDPGGGGWCCSSPVDAAAGSPRAREFRRLAPVFRRAGGCELFQDRLDVPCAWLGGCYDALNCAAGTCPPPP